MKKLGSFLVIMLLLAFSVGLSAWTLAINEAGSLAIPKSSNPLSAADRGAVKFEGAAFSGLSMAAMESHALPWRVTAGALVLDEVARNPQTSISRQTLDKILSRFGFLVDAEPANRPPGAELHNRQLPLGFTYSNIAPVGGSKLFVTNLGCAACHAGVTYTASGSPRPDQAWLGMPNTSINLEGYVQAIFKAMRNQIEDPEKLLLAAETIFPAMDWRETWTLRWLVLPIVNDRIAAFEGVERALPFPNGVPGATNGVAALKFGFKLPLFEGGKGDNGIVSVPDLGNRVWRSSLLADGAYAPPGEVRQRPIRATDIDNKHLKALADIATFFTVPSMGVQPDAASKHRGVATDIFTFLAEGYKPQPFPGPVDTDRVRLGADLFQRECASCHGQYGWSGSKPELVMFPNWIGNVKTDPLRAKTFTPQLVDAVAQTSYAGTIVAEATGRYIAPPLTGTWASAPYLHNGSVPTIDGLLNPRQRPKKFMVGGHSLDFNRLGLSLNATGEYSEDHQPFSAPVWYDTTRAGQSNEGHTFGSQLTADEKRNLIEFMKLL